MNSFTAIEQRRSIKHFDPDHRISAEETDQLLNLAMLSPSAYNIQNWRFLLAKDPELRKQLRIAAWDQSQVTDASLLIVLCADLKAWNKQPERYWEKAPQEVRDFMVPAIGEYYRGKEQVQRDEAMRSCGIAAQTLMLSAKAMGYDSCPMDGFDFDAAAKLIDLPDDHIITMFIAIGKGTKEPWPRPGQLSVNEVALQNRFPKA